MIDGPPASGVDDCDIASMCWDVEPQTGVGTCVAFCGGSEANPVCDGDTSCWIGASGALIVSGGRVCGSNVADRELGGSRIDSLHVNVAIGDARLPGSNITVSCAGAACTNSRYGANLVLQRLGQQASEYGRRTPVFRRHPGLRPPSIA